MGTKIRWHVKEQQKTREEEVWTEMVHHAKVEAASEFHDDHGRLIFKTRTRIIAPAQYKGQSIFEDFYIGTHKDPAADKDETWEQSVGFKLLREFANSFDFEPSDDMEELAVQMKDQEFLPYVKPETFYSAKEKKNRTKGTIARFYKLGTREIGSTNGATPDVSEPATTATVQPVRDYAEVPE
jgi:hypothetical protein